MSFENNHRTLAITPEVIGSLLPSLLETYGENLPDGNTTVRTIGGHWDDADRTRIRAASFPTTITGKQLTDGRIAFTALWQTDLAAEFDTGSFPMVEKLTPERLAELTTQPEL
jgi:hypothetical protein